MLMNAFQFISSGEWNTLQSLQSCLSDAIYILKPMATIIYYHLSFNQNVCTQGESLFNNRANNLPWTFMLSLSMNFGLIDSRGPSPRKECSKGKHSYNWPLTVWGFSHHQIQLIEKLSSKQLQRTRSSVSAGSPLTKDQIFKSYTSR